MYASAFLLLAACPALPSMSRVELLHPMLVHFPIALLFCAALLRLSSLFLKNIPFFSFLLPSSHVFLVIGVFMAWITIAAGEAAADIVAPTLCDEKVLEHHSMLAYFSAAGFSAVILLDRAAAWMSHHIFNPKQKLVGIIANVVLLASTITIVFTGTFGASLVFQQGAATPTPTKSIVKQLQ